MPIQNRDDAVEVEGHIATIFAASSEGRTNAIRRLFVESLDFDPLSGQVSLAGAPANAMLPAAAERIAVLDGVQVLYVGLGTEFTDRVRKAEVDAAARRIASQLGDDLLLVFTNTSSTQLHFILPKFESARPTLRRMVVERYLPRRTAVQQVANIFWNHRDKGIIRAALDAAFDVEPVTKEFFGEYRRIFEETMGAVAGFGDGGDEDKRVFVQTLFNRLMFVYFLSRKGWLRFDADADYFNALWQDYRLLEGDNNFYVSKLKPLFFAGLNNPQSRNLMKDNPVLYGVIGDVPFLNGGLFEETELDRRDGITVPDNAIRQVLTGLFDRFNFTVMESTPFDIEVAVDPEMLGKVFEELVTGRHDSGAYYTPRPVVSFMCREALKGYLGGQNTGLAAETTARFVDHQDTDGIVVAQARRIAESLAQVTVVDPACGSGAYLLGMMQELIELQTALYNAGADAKALYDLKLEIIQRNLYGVDIDSFAVNIAMLRMWLSLAIDYEGATPEPLPNLDFKVVCGDSLLGPDPSSGAEVQGTLGLDDAQVRRLGDLKGEYLRASSGADKERLRAEIAELNAGIRDALNLAETEGVVNWRIEFAEVFVVRRGFDVAIANPPYVNMVTMDRKDSDYRTTLRANYRTARGGFDIFVPFIERGIQILSPTGVIAYITPNKLLAAEYAKTVRSFLLDNSQLLSITDLSVGSVFTASVYPVITVASKGSCIEDGTTIDIFRSTGESMDLQQVTFEYSAPTVLTTRFGNLWSPLLAKDALGLLPLLENCDRLGDIATISASATVGEAYKWKEAIIDQGNSLRLSDPDRYRPFIVSGNIRPYFHTWQQSPVRYIKNRYDNPVVDISNRNISERRKRQIKSEKLIVSGMSKRPTCVHDRDGIAAGKSTVLIMAANVEDNAFICALLNSDVMQRLYLAMFGSLSLAGGFLRFGPPQISELPVPKSSGRERQEIARLLIQHTTADTEGCFESERQINETIASLFGLSH